MSHRTLLIFTLASGLLGGLLGSALTGARPEPSAPAPVVHAPPAHRASADRPPDDGSQRAMTELRREVAQLRVRLEEALATLPAPAPNAKLDGAEEIAPLPRDDTVAREEEARRVEVELLALSEARHMEVRDEAWAAAVESSVRRNLDVAGTALERVECSATLCELHARHDDPESHPRFAMGLMGPLAEGVGPVRWRSEADRTVVYLLRRGSEWPAFELESM